MPVATPDPEDDDEFKFDLTPEQRERLRKAFGNLQGAMLPKFRFNLPDLTGFAKVQESIAKAVAIPESSTKNLAAYSAIADAAAAALKPITHAQAQWAKPMSVINSDALKALTAMPKMDSVFAQIAKNAEFSDSVARIADQIARQHEATFKSIAEAAKKFSAAIYPENLRGIEDLAFEDVKEVVLEDGIALYGVPRTEIAQALIKADGTAERLAILDSEWQSITEDCRTALDRCETEYVADWVTAGLSALDAFAAGHETPAQALLGTLIDTVVNSFMGDKRYLYTPNKAGTRTTAEYKKLSIRTLIALGPVWQAFQKFDAAVDTTIPTTFSRHATIHTVSSVQYTRRNLVQGLMLACSLTLFVNERAAAEEAA